MFKNVAAKVIVFAFDTTTNTAKTGDAANITAYVSKDYGAVTALTDTSATEMDATNAKGYYLVDITATEANADILLISGKSSTANIAVIGAPAAIFTRPQTGWLAPTTAARTLDVSAGGEAGVDWANVGSPTTAVDLSGTTIKTTQKVDVDTIKTNPVVNGGTITFPTTATLASTTNITAGTITTTTNLTNLPAITANWLTAAGIAAGALDGKGDWNIGKTGYALSAAGVQAIWDALTTALTTVGSIGKLLVDNINATVSSRSSHSAADVWASAARTLTAATNITSTGGTTVPQTGDSYARIGAPAGASVSADIAAVKSDTAAILTDTGTTLDTAVSAIKTQTDKFVFTVANQVDANIQSVNDVTVTGNGQAGTEWGP